MTWISDDIIVTGITHKIMYDLSYMYVHVHTCNQVLEIQQWPHGKSQI